MAEYRKGSILARVEKLEKENTELLRQIRQRPMEFGEVVFLAAVIDHNLTKINILEELKVDVETRLRRIENNIEHVDDVGGIVKETIIKELRRLLEGEGGEKGKG